MQLNRSKGCAIFIGWQECFNGDSFALFNVDWPGNRLNNSTVTAITLNKLHIIDLRDKKGNKLYGVPKEGE